VSETGDLIANAAVHASVLCIDGMGGVDAIYRRQTHLSHVCILLMHILSFMHKLANPYTPSHIII